MITDPRLPDSLGARIAALEARIRLLESANRLQAASVRGGSLKVLDNDGNVVGAVGRVQDGNTDPSLNFASDGFMVQSQAVEDGRVLWADAEKGIIAPPQAHGWQKFSDAKAVTAITFADAWTSRVETMTSLQARFTFGATCDIGSTAQVRVLAGGTQIGATMSLGSGGGDTYMFSGAHGVPLGFGPVVFQIQARVASGSGNVWVYPPTDLTISYGYDESGLTTI